MAAQRTQSNTRGSNAGCVFWLLLFTIVVVIFAMSWGKIRENLAHTKFRESITNVENGTKSQNSSKSSDSAQPGSTPGSAPASTPTALPSESHNNTSAPSGKASPVTKTTSASQDKKTVVVVPAGTPAAPQPSQSPRSSGAEAKTASGQGSSSAPASSKNSGTTTSGAQPKTVSANPTSAKIPVRVASLYFVRIEDDGSISRQQVKRKLPVTNSPMTDALAALLAGPDTTELGQNLVSLIPQETRLLWARMEGTTAILNFSEGFMYNRYGSDGYAAQLKQVIYTATAFSNVQAVRILIEGQHRDYLGGEGIYIGSDLTRSSPL